MTTPVPAVPADLSFVTVAGLADYLGNAELLADAKKKAWLTESLQTATEEVERRVGPLEQAAYTYTVFSSGRALVLPDTHLVALGAVVDPFGNQLTVPLDGINLLAGVLTFHHRLHHGPHQVTATTREHGTTVALAVKIIAAHLFDAHRGTLVGPRAVAADPTSDGQPRTLTGFAIPRRAEQLLTGFSRPRAL